MQHMSGVATQTARMVERVAGTKAVIVDTRKTTPGMRVLEKYAVRMGGGTNHRFNLADGVLIKDNHIVAAGGITNAVNNARKMVPHTLKIEVETTNFEEIQEALEAGADIIMLDNMSCADMKKAVELIAGRAKVEASGNMGSRDIREVAEAGCGPDFHWRPDPFCGGPGYQFAVSSITRAHSVLRSFSSGGRYDFDKYTGAH